MEKAKVPVGELFKQSWETYKRKFKVMLGIAGVGLLAIGAIVFMSVLVSQGQNPTTLTLAAIRLVLVLIYLALLIYIGAFLVAAFYLAILKDLGIEQALIEGAHHAGRYFWVQTRLILRVWAGYILLIVPGIIWSITYMFGPLVSLDEGLTGGAAMKRGREYTRGYGWDIFVRIFFLGLVTVLIVIIPYIIISLLLPTSDTNIEAQVIRGICGVLIDIIVLPFNVIYTVELYRAVKNAHMINAQNVPAPQING